MRFITALGLSSALVLVQAAHGGGKTFDNEDGDYLWFSGPNWDPDGVPGLGDDVFVSADGVVLAQSDLVEVSTLMCDSGLKLAGISGLTVLGASQITDFEIATSLNAPIIADGPLLIQGNSVFRSTAVFRGVAETTIDGQLQFGSGHFIDPGVTINIVGTVDDTPIQLSPSGGQAQDGAVCRITGTFITRRGTFTSVGSGKWLVDGGEFEMFDPNTRITSGRIQMDSGTIRATVGTWELNNHDIRGGTLEAIGDGFLRLNRTAVSAPRIDATRYSNDGIEGSIELRGTVTLGPATNTITGGTSVLRLRNNTFTLDGDLTNEGNLSIISGTTIEGPGEIVSTGLMTMGGTLNTVANIEGGTATNTGSLRIGVSGLIDVGPGGVYQIGGDLTAPNNVGGRIRVAGLFENSPDGGNLARVSRPVDLEDGGTIASNGSEMQLRWGGVWSGGTLDTTTSGAEDARIVLLGEGDAFQITGDVTVTNSGLGALNSVFFGPGFGAQPMISIEGSVTADNAILAILAPSITGNGTITSRGVVATERTTTIEPALVNEAGMAFNGVTTFTSIVNNGGIEQRSNVLFQFGSEITNNGTWDVESGSSIIDNALFPPSGFQNNGTFRGDSNLSSNITARFDNGGTVIAENNASLTFRNALTTTLNADGTSEESIGGNWIRRNNGRIFFVPPPTQIGAAETTPDEPHQIEGDGDDTPWIEGVKRMKDTEARVGDTDFNEPLKLEKSKLTVERDASVTAPGLELEDSEVKIKEGALVSIEDLITGGFGGKIEMDPDTLMRIKNAPDLDIPSVVDQIQGVIPLARGDGERGGGGSDIPPTIRTPMLTLGGVMTPALGGVGSMTIDGDFVMRSTTELRVDTAGPGMTDRLDVTGSTTLAGAVVLSPAPGFIPEIGDEVVVMTSVGGFTGAITDVEAPAVEGVRWRARTVGAELRLIAACTADLAAPFGVLDLNDIAAFVTGFQSGDPIADLDGNGVFDLTDIGLFVGPFTGGC